MTTTLKPVVEKFFNLLDATYWMKSKKYRSFIDHKDGDDGNETYTFTYMAEGKEMKVEVIKTSNLDGDIENYVSATYDYAILYTMPDRSFYIGNENAKTMRSLNRIFAGLLKTWCTQLKAQKNG